MSYERDKDRNTRGVGAIAALDKNPQRHAVRRAQERRTRALDRQLAQYTYRPGGGMRAPREGLGRINMGPAGVGQHSRGGAGDLKLTDSSLPTWTGGSGGGGATPQYPTRLYGGAGTVLQQPSPGVIMPGRWPTTGGLTTTMTPVVGVMVDPMRPGAGFTTGGSGITSGGVTTGGGGGGGYNTSAPPTYPGMETPVVPDIPVDAPSGTDYKKLALIGAAAVGLWYLFGRKKSGGNGSST